MQTRSQNKFEWHVYDLEFKSILNDYIKPEIERTQVTNSRFERAHFIKETYRLLRAYCKQRNINYIKVIRDLHTRVVIESSDNLYFSFLNTTLMFYDVVKIPDFLDHQLKIFKANHYAGSSSDFVGYVEFISYDVVRLNSPSNNEGRLRAIMEWVREYKKKNSKKTKSKTESKKKERAKSNESSSVAEVHDLNRESPIQIVDKKIVDAVMEATKVYFIGSEHEKFRKIIEGNLPLEQIKFNGNQSQLTELFKRILYNKKITAKAFQLEKWIVENFCYHNIKTKEYEKFSGASVHDVISKNQRKFEPSKYNRIEVVGLTWVPFNQRKKNKVYT